MRRNTAENKFLFSSLLYVKNIQQAASWYIPALCDINLCPVVFGKCDISEFFRENIEHTCILRSQCNRSENSEQELVAVSLGHRQLAGTAKSNLDKE